MFPNAISLDKKASIKYVCSAIAFAEILSSTNLGYSSLKDKIAEGSIPIKGVFSETKSLKIDTFLSATFLACSNSPFDINARPDSTLSTSFTL